MKQCMHRCEHGKVSAVTLVLGCCDGLFVSAVWLVVLCFLSVCLSVFCCSFVCCDVVFSCNGVCALLLALLLCVVVYVMDGVWKLCLFCWFRLHLLDCLGYGRLGIKQCVQQCVVGIRWCSQMFMLLLVFMLVGVCWQCSQCWSSGRSVWFGLAP